MIENLNIENLSVSRNTTTSGFAVAAPAEFKINLNNYLSNLSYTPVRCLADIIAFNIAHPDEVCFKLLISLNLYLFKSVLMSYCTFSTQASF